MVLGQKWFSSAEVVVIGHEVVVFWGKNCFTLTNGGCMSVQKWLYSGKGGSYYGRS